MESLGICLGASTISLVHLKKNRGQSRILRAENRVHEGNPKKVLSDIMGSFASLKGINLCATGRKFKDHLKLSTISEPAAVEQACRYIMPVEHPYRLVVSAGGETIVVYLLDDDGLVQDVHTGSKCASGTGEFFLQQLKRMSIDLGEAAKMPLSEKVHRVSGRCSVFCKSDCTHALNTGVPQPEVLAGLAQMMAGKIRELLRKFPEHPTLLIGGCSRNRALVHYLRREINNLYIPLEANWFEALGAALWAQDHETRPGFGPDQIFMQNQTIYGRLEPLSLFNNMVEFKEQPQARASPGDYTVLGLDVGSTTTKGVVMRRHDKSILAADYLRTDGDPLGASRRVYASLARQLEVPVSIEGLGVTGSGRKVAGLHAMSNGVINEIIAHAAGALHFDPEIDTIFEIGGQDAKYTSITNRVPSDYVMNEACSAGTGSFLEEAAWESLRMEHTHIAATALKSTAPLDFNDQCSAFISSEIKGAIQDSLPPADIVAGLVYSVCRNYINRVKGNRPVGEKVFIQGGTCYNRAIPAAMASLTGKKMVVPPDPGLIGALGVALEVDRRIECGILQKGRFDLRKLVQREVGYGEPFRCAGNRECDRGCEIARLKINGRVFPFGGACNRYENLNHHRNVVTADLNLVNWRSRRVFRDLVANDPLDERPTVGMNRSFLVNTYFPLFNHFFSELGFRLILPDYVNQAGIDDIGASFCYPVELAHGYAKTLIEENPDFIFLPLIRSLPSGNEKTTSSTCVFVQGEPFYLGTAFPALKQKKIITLTLDFALSIEANLVVFEELAAQLGRGRVNVKAALKNATQEQELFFAALREKGKETLDRLSGHSGGPTIILFGRPYNSFVEVANKGIPAKFASRGLSVVPCDMLPCNEEVLAAEDNMYWGMGRMILKGAKYVKKDPRLFACYISNFSCGPDSFIVSCFRDIMGSKPSLLLELDSHTGDAGLETRIEAFLDIIHNYRPEKRSQGNCGKSAEEYQPALFQLHGDKPGIRTSASKWLPLSHENIRIVIPSMSRYGSPLLARAFQRININATVLPPADAEVLKLGRANTSGKECLPLQTTLGSLLNYLQKNRPQGEVSVYFMPSAEGPCRLGQYHVFTKKVLRQHQFRDVAIISPSSINGYAGLGNSFMAAAWRAMVIGDIFDEMWSTLLAGATDRNQGLRKLNREFQAVLSVIDKNWSLISRQLKKSAKALREIPLKRVYHQIPKISLVGEIYVRHDPISLQHLNERLADQGFIVRTAPNSEWINYIDWLIKANIEGERTFGFWGQLWRKQKFNEQIRKKLAGSGLFFICEEGVEPLIEAGRRFISPDLTSEAILTVGSALCDILSPACGIISIGPFGCMPSRLAEAILNRVLTVVEKRKLTNKASGNHNLLLQKEQRLPFLALETDGNNFPQIIEARLEIFLLQAQRLNEIMVSADSNYRIKLKS